ncbi:MAG: hypothetical protein ACLSAH_10515 [Bilophila wadsworthia]
MTPYLALRSASGATSLQGVTGAVQHVAGDDDEIGLDASRATTPSAMPFDVQI